MKFFLVALIAVVAAEPESQWGYHGISPLTTTYSGIYPQMYSTNYLGYNNLFNTGFRTFAKRDADADSQVFSTYSGLNHFNQFYTPSMYSTFSGVRYPTTMYTNNFHGLYKRDAESDAQYYVNSAYPTVYANQYVKPVVSSYYKPVVSSYASPIVSNYAAVSPYTTFSGLRYKRDADAQMIYPYATVAGQVNTVSQFGDFHTNTANLAKGIHNQYAAQSAAKKPIVQQYNAVSSPVHQKYVYANQYAMPAYQYHF